ncbi:Glycosyl Transferase Family Protein [Phocaeicola vulgatus]|uniref:Glycosyl Transferase Family Protein n=1 Tax=Phocaeicola vulgatus TaxID=821 RepID=A0A0P0M4Z6_PHOVU|nr:Glycosyl Transferase Family Protein [Phocaeicola vulgatus]
MMLNINQYLCKKKKNDKEHKLPLQHHYSAQEYPRLLERCLCSIPTWDEIQIIIIDDNSNSESVDFSHFPGNGRKNTEILFTKEGKGAGYARNIGLSHARGKWIIFADADDFFTADCFTILNEYMDSPHEVIYFNVRFVMSDNPSQESRRGTYYTNFFNDVNPENKLRYQSQVPWGKMIRRNFLSTFHIQFDETRIANDVYFSCLVGIYAPKQPQTEESFIIVPNPASPLLCPNKTARV